MLKQLSVFVMAALLSIGSAWGVQLQQAKSQGLVGEGNTGYLAYVRKSPSSEVKALVGSVNQQRKARFTEAAKANNLSVNQVAQRFYQRAVAATEKGHYYQNASGTWVRK